MKILNNLFYTPLFCILFHFLLFVQCLILISPFASSLVISILVLTMLSLPLELATIIILLKIYCCFQFLYLNKYVRSIVRVVLINQLPSVCYNCVASFHDVIMPLDFFMFEYLIH